MVAMADKNPWDERYSGAEYVYGTEPNDFLKEKAGSLPARGEVLCVADGEGRNGVYLASLGHRVTSVDASARGLEKAKTLAAERGVTIQTAVADLEQFDLGEERWDAIVSIFCHLPEALRRTFHPRVARALKHGGLLLLEHYHPKQIPFKTGGPPDPTMMMTLEELARDFPDFERLHAVERERVVIEGKLHGGPSYVTQALLRRP